MACKSYSSWQGLSATICHCYGVTSRLPENFVNNQTSAALMQQYHSSANLSDACDSDQKDNKLSCDSTKFTSKSGRFDQVGDFMQHINSLLASVPNLPQVNYFTQSVKFPDFKSRAKRYEIHKQIGYLKNRSLEQKALKVKSNFSQKDRYLSLHESEKEAKIVEKLDEKKKRSLSVSKGMPLKDIHERKEIFNVSCKDDSNFSSTSQSKFQEKTIYPQDLTLTQSKSDGINLPCSAIVHIPQENNQSNSVNLVISLKEQLKKFYHINISGEVKGSVVDKKSVKVDPKDEMLYKEEFETGSYKGPYGDVIIQFKDIPSRSREHSTFAEITKQQNISVFREDIEPVSQFLREQVDENFKHLASKSKPDVKNMMDFSGATLLKDLRLTTDVSGLIANLTRMSETLPSISTSSSAQKKRPSGDKLRELDIKSELITEEDIFESDENPYFDTNSPLVAMTQALATLEKSSKRQAQLSMKKDAVKQQNMKADLGALKEVKLVRSKRKSISRASVDGRTKSLMTAFSNATTIGNQIMTLERFCAHLIHYPDSRNIAVQGKIIPHLLRLRASSTNQVLLDEICHALCLLGHVDPVKGRGVRILSIDGGGTRGIIPISMLRQLEHKCQKPIREMFDYVIGVSSGAVLAFLLSIAKSSLDECESLYKEFSVEVFERNPLLGTGNLLLNHAFYDTERWMSLLRDHMKKKGEMSLTETARDPTCPKVASLATLINFGYLKDFVFRNYNHPAGASSFYLGSCQYRLWEALRASSAAPGYFKEFKLDDFVFQDGGVLTNNPCAVAVHECKLLWPDTPIQCVVSVGTGKYDPADEVPTTDYSSLKTKLLKIMDSATDSHAVHIILQDLLLPGTYFRFNPRLSEQFLLDEKRSEKLEQMQEEARHYMMENELKLLQAAGVLTHEKNVIHKAKDWIQLQRDMGRTPSLSSLKIAKTKS